MDFLRQYQKKLKKDNEMRLLIQEWKEPVFVNEKGEEFYFFVSNKPLSKELQEYMKMLDEKEREDEKIRIKQVNYKKIKKTEIFYQRLSIFCLVLGHIAEVW
jgi:bifunctional ADP-heptose synthase (sugar kinase/adenylyltransferase)